MRLGAPAVVDHSSLRNSPPQVPYRRIAFLGHVSLKMRKRKHNPKPRIANPIDEAQLLSLAERVVYRGSPYHKKHPGDYGLTPPAQPRMNRTLCDGTEVKLLTANRLLRKGAKLGLISVQQRNGFPQIIWAVSPNGIVLEAQLDNEEAATYHGYPVDPNNPLAKEVVSRWKDAEDSE